MCIYTSHLNHIFTNVPITSVYQPQEQKGKENYRHIQTDTHKHTQTHPVTHIFQTCLFAHTEICIYICTHQFFLRHIQ